MREVSIGTREYDIDLEKLMTRRLLQCGEQPVLFYIDGEERRIILSTDRDSEFSAWITATAQIMLRDLAHFEMARLINRLPLSLEQKKAVLPEAVREVRLLKIDKHVCELLRRYYDECSHINLEGFLRFRLQDVLDSWALSVDSAVEELLLKDEYMELMDTLKAYIDTAPPKMREISVILHPDGSCTLTDESDTRIDCESCSDENVISLLIGLAPEHVIVYDLTCGTATLLPEALKRIFAGRVSFFS